MKVVILAGGSGTRLWPLSRLQFPKQFLKLGGEESLLQKTVSRNLEVVEAKDIYIVTSKDYYSAVKKEVPFLEKNILLEPSQKNTAPAIMYALQNIPKEKDEVFLFCPADHIISPKEGYARHIHEGVSYAKKGFLVTFGVKPTRPETGYGYIRLNGERVEAFHEKPELRVAQEYLLSGNYLWNSGMFAFTEKAFQKECKKSCPELLQKEFSEMPSLSIDFAVMEKASNVACVPLELIWSDIGSWENVYDLFEKDQNQNVIQGDVFACDTRSSLILAEKRHVSTIGLEHILIIETEDAVLVADMRASQKVKELVSLLKNLGKKEASEHVTTHRPWGSYTVLMQGNRYKIKRIRVDALQKLSLQLHYHRSEHWVVVSGTARVTLGSEERMIHEGESIFVPRSTVHRIENPGKVTLEIIEVQVGEYLEEDDIVRLEDIYGRLKDEEAFKLLQGKI